MYCYGPLLQLPVSALSEPKQINLQYKSKRGDKDLKKREHTRCCLKVKAFLSENDCSHMTPAVAVKKNSCHTHFYIQYLQNNKLAPL